MIEVRIDVAHMQAHQHNIMHSIAMMNALRAAGMPVIGKIIFNGPERGRLVQWREQDLDGDEWVVHWYDDDEVQHNSPHHYKHKVTGHGHGYRWTRYSDDEQPAQREEW